MKVLIVEDDFISRNYLSSLMKFSGYQCLTAKNAAEGLDLYLECKPDAIVCSMVMPGISGLEFLREIRTNDRRTIIIMIANRSSERLAIDALRLGANDYIKKPVQDSDILPAIKRAGSRIVLDDEPEQPYGMVDSGKIVMKFKTEFDAPRLIVERLMKEIKPQYFEPDSLINIELGLMELVTNAIEHGNLNITYQEKLEVTKDNGLVDLYHKRLQDNMLAARKVTVEFAFSQQKCEWTITDEGNGFDPSSIPDPIAKENIENLSGRGIFISKFAFDNVEYLGKGNCVHVTKMCQKSAC